MDPKDWVTQAEAARLRQVSRQAISSLISTGRLRTVTFEGRRFVSREDVQNFVALPAGRKQRNNRRG
jgi:hypothetical protein